MSKLKAYFNSIKAMRITAIVMAVFWMIAITAKPVTPQIQTKEVIKEVPKVEVKEVVKEVPTVKTPESCKNVIDIDNDIFTFLGNNLSSLQFAKIAEYLDKKTPARTAAVINGLANK